MKNKVIHELINLKERRLEVEVELGVSNIERSHLSRKQLEQISHDLKFNKSTFKELNCINQFIKSDEQILSYKH